jgi:sugar phosphate isomerase/epimerase
LIKPSFFTDEVSEDLERAVMLGAEAGATHVELRGALFGKNVTTIDEEDVLRIKEILGKYGLSCGVIGSPFGKCDHNDERAKEAHLSMFERMIRIARSLGAKAIRGFAFWNPGGRSRPNRPRIEEYMEVIVPFISPAARMAHENGLTFVLETEEDTLVGTCEEARKVIEAVGEKGIGICWDLLNAWRSGEPPYPDGYEGSKGLIRHLHIKPNSSGNMKTIGESDISYKAIFELILADGYDGFATIEHWGSPPAMLRGIRELVSVISELQP